MRTSASRRAALAAALLLLAAACSKKQDMRNKPAVPVLVTRVKKSSVPYSIEANGVVTPLQSAAVNSQVEGIIQRVAFREGQDVVKGQLLFEIDSRPYRATYQQALANLARDRANAENAQREAQRYASLAQQDYVTREQADQQRANAASTAANVAASLAAVASAKFNLDNTAIRAPISGRTGGLLVREGNVVHASGATPLVVINQVSPILVRFSIPSTQLPLLQRYGTAGGLVVQASPNTGTASTVDTAASGPIGLNMGGGDPSQSSGGPPGAGSGNANGAGGTPGGASSQLVTLTQPENGSLFFIDNAVDTTTGTVLLKASFPNPNRRLWAGEFVTAKLELFVEQNALVVPAAAVVTGQQGPYVYVVSDSMTVKQRTVTVERTAGSITVIASGLREGETIVSEGQSRLTPNAKVVVNTPQGAPTGGPGGRRGGRGSGGAGGANGGPGGGARPAGAGGAGGGQRGAPAQASSTP